MGIQKDLIDRRRNKTIATILSFKDAYCDQYLPEQVALDLRQEILDEINGLCNFVIELSEGETVYNEIFRERFDKMYEMVLEIYED